MKIIHLLNNIKYEKEIDEKEIGFLITNKIGGFFSQGIINNFTKYNGFFLCLNNDDDFNLIKTIETIKLNNINNQKNNQTLINNFNSIQIITKDVKEKYYIQNNNLFYQIDNYNDFIDLIFDCRKIYDFNDEGRIYKIYKEDKILIIEYIKYNDKSLNNENYKIYSAIIGIDEFEINNEWIKTEYELDKSRETNYKTMYTYNALKIKINQKANIIFSFSNNKDEAKKNAIYNYNNFEKNINQIKNNNELLNNNNIEFKNNEELMAYNNATNSLNLLITSINKNNNHNIIDNENQENIGIFAGLPWFHQFWTRDEAISIGALIENKNYELAKKILLRQLKFILEDGRISNRWPPSILGSADGVGWTFKRIHDLIKSLDKNNLLNYYINKNEFIIIKKSLQKCIVLILENYANEGLIYNNELETWMDTYFENDKRCGYRIEIQALMLSMYSLMRTLCKLTNNQKKYEIYKKTEELTKIKIKEHFFKDNILYDGINDKTIRPNIFLTYYIYPNLFTKKEWKLIFNNALEKLWLSWGGVSTIEKDNLMYFDEYTGENNKSYHRGDSWYFINNITAICLYDVDKNYYKEKINKIKKASIQDILYMGFIGHSSELSSAKLQSAKASLVQAWSAATLIELLNKTNN
jgi:hypothetical protein